MAQQRIVVIGLGGIGSWLLQGLCPFLNYQPNESWSLVLVDGDDYEDKNHTRQAFTELGPKANVQTRWIAQTFPKLAVQSVPEYISAGGAKDTRPISQVIQTGDIVFSCVDNHKTRRVIAKYCATLKDVVLISGGNDYIDGNIQIFMRREGENLTVTLDKFHPEIAKPQDRAPFELSCEELAISAPQLIFANMMAASLMLNAFYTIKEGKMREEWSEVYFDLILNAATPRERKK